MPGSRFESRRRQWRDETIETKVGLLLDDVDELEVKVSDDVAALRKLVEVTVERQEESAAKSTRQTWAILLTIIGAMLSIIAALMVRL